ncbi:lactate racemase domain-containing protein, partial [Planctomycetota bacterium]
VAGFERALSGWVCAPADRLGSIGAFKSEAHLNPKMSNLILADPLSQRLYYWWTFAYAVKKVITTMDIDVHYGNDTVFLKIPQVNVQAVVCPWQGETSSRKVDLAETLEASSALTFRKATKGRCLCVLVPDATRRTPFEDNYRSLMDHLGGCEQVRCLICTGTHDPCSAGNIALRQRIEQTAHMSGLKDFSCEGHDCRSSALIEGDTTLRGTPVRYHPWLQEAEVFLVLSDVKVHYFAGYSNPVKNFVPGACAYETIEQNHSLALHDQARFGQHPWHCDPGRRDNPLAQDQLEAMTAIVGDRPVFAWVTIGMAGQAYWDALGLAEEVTRAAITVADTHNIRDILPVDKLIVSPGGHPDDIDLYIAQRALELSQAGVKEGGEVLFLAACPGGVGEVHTRANFYERLIQPLDTVLTSIDDAYVLYSHKPYKFARMIQRLNRLWFVSEIPDDQVKAMHLTPAGSAQEIVNRWLTQDPQTRIMVVDGANKLGLRCAGEGK